MPLVFEPMPLGEHRARALEYLRTIVLPFQSVAGTIIAERLPPEEERVLLRACLVLWSCSACGGDVRDALPVAAAFDFFDSFMYLHDELVDDPPAADRSESPVARWGLGQSLNAGDAIYAIALRSLAQHVVHPERRLKAAALVTREVLAAVEDRASGSERSATLTGAALEAGALIAGASVDTLRGFNRAGRLLDDAVSSRDPETAARFTARAVGAVERCIPDPSRLGGFEEVARYVAARAI